MFTKTQLKDFAETLTDEAEKTAFKAGLNTIIYRVLDGVPFCDRQDLTKALQSSRAAHLATQVQDKISVFLQEEGLV